MGVSGLWPILAPVKKHRSLSSLRGQTLAVDLSIWVCENQGVRQMQSRVMKPHLRNLFFRVSTMLQLGINLVFVIEGEAPALKHVEMGRRMQARNHCSTSVSGNTKRKFGRGRLQGFLKECCELLDALGVPYIQSQGEAESTCAALNAAGVVDACVSDDGDCFLYGAKVVYRNLTLDVKDPHVESFSMADVTSELGLTRERLVALALLLGCDYFPAGVPGVGEAWAVKLMKSLAGADVLKRFQQWKHMTASDCIDSTEVFVWRRAAVLTNFPPHKVIEEFLVLKENVPGASPQWQRPSILKMMSLGTRYLEWPEEYSLEKILPLATLWNQQCIMNSSTPPASSHLQPCRIVKKRVRQGVPSFEVEWENSIKGLVDETGQPRSLVTIEAEDRFRSCFPVFVESFTQHAEQLKATKTKRARKPKSKKDVDTLASEMDALKINSGVSCPAENKIQQSQRFETARKEYTVRETQEREERLWSHSQQENMAPTPGIERGVVSGQMSAMPFPSDQLCTGMDQLPESCVSTSTSTQKLCSRSETERGILSGQLDAVSISKEKFHAEKDQKQLHKGSVSAGVQKLYSRSEAERGIQSGQVGADAISKDTSHTTKEQVPKGNVSAGAQELCSRPGIEGGVLSGPMNAVSVSVSTKDHRELTKDCVSAGAQKLCTKKQTSSSSLRTEKPTSSQAERKAVVLADLLGDWSDDEDSDSEDNSHCGGCTSHNTITISDDEETEKEPVPKPQEKENLFTVGSSTEKHTALHKSPVAERQHPVNAAKWNTFSTTPDSASFISETEKQPVPETQGEESYLFTVEGCAENYPALYTPSAAGRQDGVSVNTGTTTPDCASFVSDGHFTLHHTLFTSMEDSYRDVSVCSEQAHAHSPNMKDSDRDVSACSEQAHTHSPNMKYSYRDVSACSEQAHMRIPSSVVELKAGRDVIPSTSTVLDSLTSYGTSPPSPVSSSASSVAQDYGRKLGELRLNSARMGDGSSVFSRVPTTMQTVYQQQVSVGGEMASETITQIDRTVQAADQSSVREKSSQVDRSIHTTGQSSSSVVTNSSNGSCESDSESESCDESYTFLPLSQRLRMKQLNTTALNGLAHL